MDGESGFRLGDVHRRLQQDFRLRTEPVLVSMAVGESAGFKQLVGTARDQVIYLLRMLDKWVAKGVAWMRGLSRNRGRKGFLLLGVLLQSIRRFVGEELFHC